MAKQTQDLSDNQQLAESPRDTGDILALTTQIIVALLTGNAIQPEAVPDLIAGVRRTLAALAPAPDKTPQEPAVPIKRSVQPDYIVCLEDGESLVMLKRHLRVEHNLTPEEYRRKWGLPDKYPMVAPNYAKRRSALAKMAGLGTNQLGRRPGPGATARRDKGMRK